MVIMPSCSADTLQKLWKFNMDWAPRISTGTILNFEAWCACVNKRTHLITQFNKTSANIVGSEMDSTLLVRYMGSHMAVLEHLLLPWTVGHHGISWVIGHISHISLCLKRLWHQLVRCGHVKKSKGKLFSHKNMQKTSKKQKMDKHEAARFSAGQAWMVLKQLNLRSKTCGASVGASPSPRKSNQWFSATYVHIFSNKF